MHSAEISLTDIPENSLTRVEHNGVQLVVVRSAGQVLAYLDRCPHAFWPLSEGTLDNSVIECPGHGWEFDVHTGRCLNAPDHCLTAVPVVVEHNIVRFQPLSSENTAGPAENGAEPAESSTSGAR